MEALAALRSAMNRWQQLDAPYEVACTRRLLAAAYRALGDADAAAREEAAVQSCFDRLGVITDPPASLRGLTAREVEVVRLVASGLSNRAIAEELVLSEKTVARHLSNIFAKLDVTSRSGVTAFAYDSGLMGRTTHS
jgi:DNA-binding NarL/FixJ family response regulator